MESRPEILPLWKRGNEGDLWRGRFQALLYHHLFLPTSNLRLAEAPGNIMIRASESGLPKDSVVNVSQIITVDKTILAEKCGRLPIHAMRSVDEGLRLVLSLYGNGQQMNEFKNKDLTPFFPNQHRKQNNSGGKMRPPSGPCDAVC
jgi:hypothetical protein